MVDMEKIMATKQREWQKKMQKEGRCVQCGKDSHGKLRCPECNDKQVAINKKNREKK